MPVDHLRKNRARIQKSKKANDSRYIYQNKLNKSFFFNMKKLMEILRIYIGEQLLIRNLKNEKYTLINNLL